jgi:sigma-B regulation protein RsbU (phosphoserine phosphatase)
MPRSKAAGVRHGQPQLASVDNRAAVEASPDPLVGIDTQGQIADVNAAFEAATGCARADLIGSDFSACFTEPSNARAMCEQALRQGFVHNYPLELRHCDGQVISLLCSAAQYRDERGSVVGLFAAARDITEHKRSEAALRDSEAALKRAQEIAHIGSWSMDYLNNRLIVSDEVIRIFGAAPDDPTTYESIFSVVHPDDRQAVDQVWDSALNTGAFEMDHRIVVGDEVRWLRQRAEIAFDEGGEATRVDGIVQDITDRKRAEQEIHLLARLQTVVAELGLWALKSPCEAVLERAVALVAQTLDADCCTILEVLPDIGGFVLRAAVGCNADDVGRATIKSARTQLEYTAHGSEPVIVGDAAAETRFTPLPRLLGDAGGVSAVCVVIPTTDGAYGVLGAYTRVRRDFASDEVHFLQTIAHLVGSSVERQRREEELRRLNAELEQRVLARTAELAAARDRETTLASRIQQTLLRDRSPKGVAGVQVGALALASLEVDGDFYGFFQHEHSRFDLFVGDVMGKGTPAALLGAATKVVLIEALAHLMALAPRGELPQIGEIVGRAHAGLVHQLIDLDSFVTLCYGRFDLQRNLFQFVDCGHTGAVRLAARSSDCSVLHGDNLPLGIREGERHRPVTVVFEPGDLFVLFSDGITEAANANRELFGVERLLDCVRVNREREPQELVELIRSAVVQFSGSEQLKDDLTCVAIKILDLRIPPGRRELEVASTLSELGRVRAFVREVSAAADQQVSERWIGELELAVNEAAANIIKHAHHNRAHERIQLEADVFPKHLLIRLLYLGEAFDPAQVVPFDPSQARSAFEDARESGFGLYLMSQTVDTVHYSRDERGRNCITFVKAYS